MLAVKRGDQDMCRTILTHPDVDITVMDNENITPLVWSSVHGYKDILNDLTHDDIQ